MASGANALEDSLAWIRISFIIVLTRQQRHPQCLLQHRHATNLSGDGLYFPLLGFGWPSDQLSPNNEGKSEAIKLPRLVPKRPSVMPLCLGMLPQTQTARDHTEKSQGNGQLPWSKTRILVNSPSQPPSRSPPTFHPVNSLGCPIWAYRCLQPTNATGSEEPPSSQSSTKPEDTIDSRNPGMHT